MDIDVYKSENASLQNTEIEFNLSINCARPIMCHQSHSHLSNPGRDT